MKWRTRVLGLTLSVASMGTLLSAAAPAAEAVPCTDVHIVGLRGSGEPSRPVEHGMGSLVGPVANLIAEQVQDAGTVSFHGLPYKAGDATIGTVLSRSYFASKEAGMKLLHEYLVQEIAACPSEKIVVIGYSQGAHAAGDQLAKEPKSITDHIGALVMFGDPRFNPSAAYAWGTFDSRNYGLNGKRSLSDFAGWTSRVFSVCNNYDQVCQGIGVKNGSAAHSQSGYVSAYGSLIAGLVRRKLGYPRPASATTPLDLAFVIDSTGSMGSSIAGVTAAAANIAETLKDRGADFRVGLVDYKDHGDAYASRVALPMTSDATLFGTAVGALRASGGGDTPEAVYSGLMTAINHLSWRAVPRKAIILMGDAPAKNPEPVTGYTEKMVLDAARALDPATIHPVTVGTAPTSSFAPLAAGSGGQLFAADNAASVAARVTAAVDQAAIPLYTSLTVGGPARPGAPVPFSAAGSAYDAGDIADYRWDFDGDGTIDRTTTENRTSYSYPAPFTGIAAVTVTTTDGHQGTVTAEVDIRADAPLPPGAPDALRVRPSGTGNAITVSWSAPPDLGGGSLVGYTVTLEGPSPASSSVDPGTGDVTFEDLDAGTYRVAVAAVTEAGAGPEAETSVDAGHAETAVESTVGGSVPATLALTLAPVPELGPFIPGVTREYAATTSAHIISSAGDATLTVADPSTQSPGRLTNGAFAMRDPLVIGREPDGPWSSVAGATLATYAAPVANDAVALELRQQVHTDEPLRTGRYAKAVTFTLSTTSP